MKRIMQCGIWVGIIFFIIGAYYAVVKAGVPYQDPTPEMLKEYYKNVKIGETCVLIGIGVELVSVITLHILKSKNNKKQR